MAFVSTAYVRTTSVARREVLMPFDFLGFFAIRIILFLVIRKFTPHFTM